MTIRAGSIRIGLIRHGRTSWNNDGRIQGRTDVPITAEEETSLRGFELPESWATARLVSSPLLRAKVTAQIIASRPPQINQRLIEMDFGDWEGARGEDLLADPESGFRHITEWSKGYRAPNGESVAEVDARVHAAAVDLAREGEDTLIVSHIGVMRALLARAHRWPYLGEPPFKVKRERIYMLRVDTGGSIEIEGTEPERLVKR